MAIIKRGTFFLRNKQEAELFGEFCARDRRLEVVLETSLSEAKFMVDKCMEPSERAEHINDMLNFGEALLRCAEITRVKDD